MRTHRLAAAALSLLLTAALTLSLFPVEAYAASSAEIQKEIAALEAKNAEIEKQINAIQKQYNANFNDMKDIVEQKSAIDQEISLLNSKVDTTNEQIAAFSQQSADTQE